MQYVYTYIQPYTHTYTYRHMHIGTYIIHTYLRTFHSLASSIQTKTPLDLTLRRVPELQLLLFDNCNTDIIIVVSLLN